MEIARPRRFWVQSISDPRWNFVGEGVCTRFDVPKEVKDWLEAKQEEFGTQPTDLKVGYY